MKNKNNPRNPATKTETKPAEIARDNQNENPAPVLPPLQLSPAELTAVKIFAILRKHNINAETMTNAEIITALKTQTTVKNAIERAENFNGEIAPAIVGGLQKIQNSAQITAFSSVNFLLKTGKPEIMELSKNFKIDYAIDNATPRALNEYIGINAEIIALSETGKPARKIVDILRNIDNLTAELKLNLTALKNLNKRVFRNDEKTAEFCQNERVICNYNRKRENYETARGIARGIAETNAENAENETNAEILINAFETAETARAEMETARAFAEIARAKNAPFYTDFKKQNKRAKNRAKRLKKVMREIDKISLSIENYRRILAEYPATLETARAEMETARAYFNLLCAETENRAEYNRAFAEYNRARKNAETARKNVEILETARALINRARVAETEYTNALKRGAGYCHTIAGDIFNHSYLFWYMVTIYGYKHYKNAVIEKMKKRAENAKTPARAFDKIETAKTTPAFEFARKNAFNFIHSYIRENRGNNAFITGKNGAKMRKTISLEYLIENGAELLLTAKTLTEYGFDNFYDYAKTEKLLNSFCLSKREKTALKYRLRGYSITQIAKKFNLKNRQTVNTYFDRIRQKTGNNPAFAPVLQKFNENRKYKNYIVLAGNKIITPAEFSTTALKTYAETATKNATGAEIARDINGNGINPAGVVSDNARALFNKLNALKIEMKRARRVCGENSAEYATARANYAETAQQYETARETAENNANRTREKLRAVKNYNNAVECLTANETRETATKTRENYEKQKNAQILELMKIIFNNSDNTAENKRARAELRKLNKITETTARGNIPAIKIETARPAVVVCPAVDNFNPANSKTPAETPRAELIRQYRATRARAVSEMETARAQIVANSTHLRALINRARRFGYSAEIYKQIETARELITNATARETTARAKFRAVCVSLYGITTARETA